MKPETIHNKARGLAIGDPERFQGSPVYEEVKGLPYAKGPGLMMDDDGNLVWRGKAGDAYKRLLKSLTDEAGLSQEEATALWSFLDYKRSNVWYVKGQKRTSESRMDEERVAGLNLFEHNNLRVELKNGMTLAHFMAIHYGVNWFTYRVWPKFAQWKNRAVVRAASQKLIPEFQPGEAPESGGDLILWRLKLEMMARFPTLGNPALAVERATGRYKRNVAKVKLAAMEDTVASVEIMDEVRKLGRKLNS